MVPSLGLIIAQFFFGTLTQSVECQKGDNVVFLKWKFHSLTTCYLAHLTILVFSSSLTSSFSNVGISACYLLPYKWRSWLGGWLLHRLGCSRQLWDGSSENDSYSRCYANHSSCRVSTDFVTNWYSSVEHLIVVGICTFLCISVSLPCWLGNRKDIWSIKPVSLVFKLIDWSSWRFTSHLMPA